MKIRKTVNLTMVTYKTYDGKAVSETAKSITFYRKISYNAIVRHLNKNIGSGNYLKESIRIRYLKNTYELSTKDFIAHAKLITGGN